MTAEDRDTGAEVVGGGADRVVEDWSTTEGAPCEAGPEVAAPVGDDTAGAVPVANGLTTMIA